MNKAMMGVVTLTAVLAVGACGGAPSEETSQESADLSAQANTALTQLAYGDVTGLYQSTGNLYWTDSGTDSTGAPGGAFMRMGKSNPPGDEVALYTASGLPGYSFGNVVWALSDTYYGYFVVNYEARTARPRSGVHAASEIVRFPLAGGPASAATVVAQSPDVIGARDVATDGTSLFWADATGIRKISLPDGNDVTTLAQTTTSSHIGLDSTSVYFEQGSAIQRVSKNGGLITNVFNATENVTTFLIDQGVYIFWGEAGGAVREVSLYDGSIYTFQGPIAGRNVISLAMGDSSTVSRTEWIDCAEPNDQDCHTRGYTVGGTVTVPESAPAIGAGHLQADATSAYWSDSTGVKKYNW